MLSEQQFLSTYLKIFERLSDFGTQLVPTTSELNLSGSTSYVSAVRMLVRTTPEAQADFEGSIKSYSSNISFSARHASDLCGVMRLAPSLWGKAPSSSSISCSTKLQQPISALCFEEKKFRVPI